MRRWTVLVVSHDSNAPRTYSITERMLRVVAGGALVLFLVALIGLGTIIASLGSLGEPGAPTMARSAATLGAPTAVDSLRQRVGELRGLIDTIRSRDARLRRELGEPGLDTTSLLKRFVARFPRFLRAPSPPAAASAVIPGDSLALREVMTGAQASTDSLIAHAGTLATRIQGFVPREPWSLDTLDRLSLRPESLAVSAARGTRVVREGKAVRWEPQRSGAVLAGFDGEVSRVTVTGSEHFEVEIRAKGGLQGRIRATGQAVVRAGERVRVGQPVALVVVSSPDSLRFAQYEVRRNGVLLDPARGR